MASLCVDLRYTGLSSSILGGEKTASFAGRGPSSSIKIAGVRQER